MKLKTTALAVCAISASLMIATPALAGVPHNGGVWSYGCNNNPSNWGAFSDYQHPTQSHWSSVTRDSDAKTSRGTAGAGGTSTSFVNTSFGETAYFDCGF